MKDVAETLHLQRRGGVWYYFRRVPKPLVPIVGKQFIKLSLQTDSLARAKQLRAIHELNADALFAAAQRGEPSDHGSSKGRWLLPVAALTDHVRSLVEAEDLKAAEYLLAHPVADEDDLEERQRDAEYELGILTNPADPRQAELTDRVAQRLLMSIGAELPDLASEARLDEMVRRALIELCRRKIGRYENRFDRFFYDKLFNPDSQRAVGWGELAGQFIAEKEEEFQLNAVSDKRLDKIKASVATLSEIIGNATPASAIDDDIVQRVRSQLARHPANRMKLYPGVPIEDAVERAKAEGKRTLSSQTQAHYLDVLRDVLRVGVRKKYLASNPAEGIRPLKKDGLSPSERRKPWSNEQVVRFFTGTFYQSCAIDAVKPYGRPDRDWRFWLPLIMLFSGARPNEICQLTVDDVGQTEAGTRYISLTDEREGNQLKTAASRRRVPIHPELIRLGFLQFVARRKLAKDGARLFPSLKANKYGNWAWYPVKRFGDSFLSAEITLEERQSLYSLRHNVRDALRRAKAPPETLQAVTGWSPAGKSVSDHYGDPGNPDHHAEFVEKISYPGLDLSFLAGQH